MISSHPKVFGHHNSTKSNHCDISCTATDINNHIADSLANWELGADSGSHWLFNQKHLTGAGVFGGVASSPHLDVGDTGWYSNQNTRRYKRTHISMDFIN